MGKLYAQNFIIADIKCSNLIYILRLDARTENELEASCININLQLSNLDPPFLPFPSLVSNILVNFVSPIPSLRNSTSVPHKRKRHSPNSQSSIPIPSSTSTSKQPKHVHQSPFPSIHIHIHPILILGGCV